jgi:hypothetical protein
VEEKEAKGHEEWGPKHWKHHSEYRRWREPISGIVFGLMVVWLGVCFYLKHIGTLPADLWWAYLLVGFGGLWILGGIVRLFVPRWHRGLLGAFIPGIVVGTIGLMFILGSWQYWPIILVAVGLVIVVSVIVQHVLKRRSKEDAEP